jgi:UDP-N-acetylmuramate--alanine ligase
MYPGRKLTGVFQPHLFSRTRDFADEFAASLDLLDKCILLEIYPAREKPIEGVSSQMLLDKMKISNKQICTKENLVETLKSEKPQILMTMGAGDIDSMVEPIVKSFTN